MKTTKRFLIIITALILFTVLGYSFKSHINRKADNLQGFAVVELFTSEGCSSCPPADGVLAKLSQENKTNVYTLSFHVDYWNRLGWKDAFSNAIYSQRQYRYGRVFNLNSVYTPQVIVNGKTQFTGSNATRLKNTIEEELKNKSAASIELSAKSINSKTINVSYKINDASGNLLNIALIQLHAQSSVKRGENAGRVLPHVNVVREFKTIDLNKEAQGNITLSLPAGLSIAECKIIAYIQQKR